MNVLEFINKNKAQIESIFDSCNNRLFEATSPEELAEAVESEGDIQDFIIKAYQDSGLDHVEIIYYSKAMEYLAENDPTLRESLELADDMDFSPRDLNSELLASIHATDAESCKIANAAKDLADFIATEFEG